MVGAAEVLMEGVVFGESPRWHDGRLWFSDWRANAAHRAIVAFPAPAPGAGKP